MEYENPNQGYQQTGNKVPIPMDTLIEHVHQMCRQYDELHDVTGEDLPMNPYRDTLHFTTREGKTVQIPQDVQQKAIKIWEQSKYQNMGQHQNMNQQNPQYHNHRMSDIDNNQNPVLENEAISDSEEMPVGYQEQQPIQRRGQHPYPPQEPQVSRQMYYVGKDTSNFTTILLILFIAGIAYWFYFRKQ